MGPSGLLLMTALVAAPPSSDVEVSTLSGQLAIVPAPRGTSSDNGVWYELRGDRHSGQLQRLTADEVTVQVGDTTQKLPANEVVAVHFRKPAQAETAETPKCTVRLTDGSVITGQAVNLGADGAVLDTRSLGKIRVARNDLRSVRYQDLGSLSDEWNALRMRTTTRDFLVIRKEKEVVENDMKRVVPTLDHIPGIVTAIGPEDLRFQLDGNEVEVKTSKVFGVFLRPRESAAKPRCTVHTVSGDTLECQSVTIEGETADVVSASGAKLNVPTDRLALVDFQRQRFDYLSALDPREVEYTPFFDFTIQYRRDKYSFRQPLRMAGQRFARGLFMHSGTHMKYRLAGEYRRFQAVIGIDQETGGGGNLVLTISGDGRELFRSQIVGKDAPRVVDLDVTNVRDLEILAEFGEEMATLDHLDLADAKLVR